MAYCRFSTDDFKCDLYIYEDCNGGYTTHLAKNRVEYQSLLPELIELTVDNVVDWHERHHTVMHLYDEAKKVEIDLPFAGEYFNDETAEELIERLIELRRIGYRFPADVIEAILEESLQETK